MAAANDTDAASAFKDAMAEMGVVFEGAPIMDGKLHRVDIVGRRKGAKHGWYVGYLDGVPAGAFGDYKAGLSETWCQKRPERMSDDERRALRERMEAARKEREDERARVQAEARAAALSIWQKAAKASADHPYLARKGIPPLPGLKQLGADVRYVIDGDRKTARAGALVVPLFRPDGTLASVQLIDAEGVKRFLKGTEKAGSYTSLGKRPTEEKPVILICEGYATAAQVHRATGRLVVAAFDAGNLEPVAKAMRAKYPTARILLAADNDAHTRRPDGSPWNPGLEAAIAAARAVKGRVAVPLFPEGDLTSTDFDDLARLEGLDNVKAALRRAVPPGDVGALLEEHARAEASAAARAQSPQAHDEPPPHDAVPEGPDAPTGEIRDLSSPPDDEAPAAEEWSAPHFRCLGVDGTTYYYQPARVAQIIELPSSAHTETGLLRLAPLHWWESTFPKKGGCDWASARNACIRSCVERGKFVQHIRARGRGAWFEDDEPVFHAGDRLIRRGREVSIFDHRSRWVYDEAEPIRVQVDDPATTQESRRVLDLCKSLRWGSPLSGYMLAGWCVIAPVCGFLNWRPHVWINGPAGSGKSTVMDRIVRQLIAETALSVVGPTTEAGIRSALGTDARPVIFDEAEPKDMHNQARIRSILDLARVAASESEGLILKGTSNQRSKGFRIRSCMVFASINTQIEGYADETRFTQLTLAAPEAETDEQRARNKAHYEKLVADIVSLLTPQFARRLLARTILNLPVLREYVRVFSAAATLHLGNQRLGDQVAPMLAGAYFLHTTAELTVEKALSWLRANDLSEHSAVNGETDQARFIATLAGFTVKNQTPEGGNWERPIGELIELCLGPEWVVEDGPGGVPTSVPNRSRTAADKALRRIGFCVHSIAGVTLVDVSTTSPAIKNRILRGTEWAATNIGNLLKSIEGATRPKTNRQFAPGLNTPRVTLPVEVFIGQREPGEDAS